jgi:hypothetical protein
MSLHTDYEGSLKERDSYRLRAEAGAAVTIPTAFPPDGWDDTEDLPVPWQSVGADGLASLASKLKQVLFPANVPFFRLSLTQQEIERVVNDLEEAAQGDGNVFQQAFENFRQDADSVLALYETEAMKLMESRGDGPKQYDVFLQLLVAGNVLIKDTRLSREFSVHRLDSYVVTRDDTGRALKVILKETLSRQSIEELPNMKKEAKETLKEFFGRQENKETKELTVYTGAKLKDGKYEVTQEIVGMDKSEPMELSKATFETYDLPLRALRLYDSGGENYSRSYVEQYLGDLRTLDGIYKAITEGTAAATRFIWLVSPNSQTDPEDFNKAMNGDAITGNPGDITPLTSEGKIRDLASAYQLADRIEARIGKAFLLHSSVQRDAERVTATEVARLIQELETQLGGIYSILSQEFQRPYVWFLLKALKALPTLDLSTVESAIITGQDALGRTDELQRIDQFLARMGSLPDGAMYLRTGELLQRIGKSLAIPELRTLLKTTEEVQQEMQAAQQAQMQAQMAMQQAQQGPEQAV